MVWQGVYGGCSRFKATFFLIWNVLPYNYLDYTIRPLSESQNKMLKALDVIIP